MVRNNIKPIMAGKVISCMRKAIIISFVLVLWASSDLFSATPFRILNVKSNGDLVIQSIQSEIQLDKVWTGNKKGAWLWNNLFFAINNDLLRVTNLDTGDVVFNIELRKQLDKEEHPWKIGHVDNDNIFFCTYSYDQGVSINKQEKLYNIYQINMNTKIMRRLPIDDCSNESFSVLNGDIYYTDTNGKIVHHNTNKGISKYLEIKGEGPVISPDGEKIIYSRFGIMNTIVMMYDFGKNDEFSIIKFFGPSSCEPIKRWSNDSQLIAVKKSSDIKKTSLYVIDSQSMSTIAEFKRHGAVNWFLIE